MVKIHFPNVIYLNDKNEIGIKMVIQKYFRDQFRNIRFIM